MSIYNAMGIILRWKKFNDMLEIDILRYFLQNTLCVDCPEGQIWMIWVSKWDPDATLAKTMVEGGCISYFIYQKWWNVYKNRFLGKVQFIKWAALMVNRDFGPFDWKPSKLPRLFETSL